MSSEDLPSAKLLAVSDMPQGLNDAEIDLAHPCYLLENLPRELRDQIYELVFNDEIKADDEDIDCEGIPYKSGNVDLCKAFGPSKSLLLANKQIYKEARRLHQDAYREYWSTSAFFLFFNYYEPKRLDAIYERIFFKYWCTNKDFDAAMHERVKDAVELREFEHITKLYVSGLALHYSLVDVRGLWQVRKDSGSPIPNEKEFMTFLPEPGFLSFAATEEAGREKLPCHQKRMPMLDQLRLVMYDGWTMQLAELEEAPHITEAVWTKATGWKASSR